MLNVDIIGQEFGESYSFKNDGKTFTLTIPCTGDPATATDTIAMWYYDKTSGLWIEEGTATKSLNATTGDYEYTGTVSHFSGWNMELKVPNLTSVYGTMQGSPETLYTMKIRSDGFF